MAADKMMQKVSKSTLGTAVDTVADYADLVSQFVVEYFNQRYKIKKKVEDVKRATIQALYDLKKEFIKSIVEALFLVTGILALVVGIILLMSRYIPLEYILILYGLVVTIVVLLKMKVSA
jgi:hypothetical protein